MKKSIQSTIANLKSLRKKIRTNRRNGKLGGLKTSSLMTDEQKHDRAVAGGTSTKMRYGKDYYRHISKLGIKKISKNRKNTKRYKQYIEKM